MSDERRVHELLKAGLDYLERYGWVPHYGAGIASTCMASALMRGSRDRPELRHVLSDAHAALSRATGRENYADWNDAQTSFTPVKAAYCRAIQATAPSPDLSFLSNPEQSPSLAEEVVAP